MKSALDEFKGRKKIFLLVLLELVLAVSAVVSFLKLLDFNVLEAVSTRKYSFSLSNNLLDFLLFGLSVAFFALVYLAIRRIPVLFRAQKRAFSEIKQTARQKMHNAKSDSRVLGLLVIEFFFVIIVFVSLSAFFDPEFELIPWSKLGVFPPETTIINAIIAVLVLAGFYWLYSQTAEFRKDKKKK